MRQIKRTKETKMLLRGLDHLRKSEELVKASLIKMYEEEFITEELNDIEEKSNELRELYRSLLIENIVENIKGGCELA